MWYVRTLIVFVLFSPIINFLPMNVNTTLAVILFLDFVYSNHIFWSPLYLFGAFLGKNYSVKIETLSFSTRKLFY